MCLSLQAQINTVIKKKNLRKQNNAFKYYISRMEDIERLLQQDIKLTEKIKRFNEKT